MRPRACRRPWSCASTPRRPDPRTTPPRRGGATHAVTEPEALHAGTPSRGQQPRPRPRHRLRPQHHRGRADGAPHKLSQTSVTAQSYVIVQLRLANGAEGIGEAATLGGPRWSEESVEAMKANIDAYLAPAIIGQRADRFEAAGIRMDQAAKRNNAAKAAIETALFDAVGKTPRPARRRPARRRGAGPLPRALDSRLRRPGAGGGGGRAQARGPPASHLQGEDRRAGARGRHGPDAPPRPRAGRPRRADRRRQPGLGRDRGGALPAAARRNGRTAGGAARARLEHRRHGAAARPARHAAAAGRRMRLRRA